MSVFYYMQRHVGIRIDMDPGTFHCDPFSDYPFHTDRLWRPRFSRYNFNVVLLYPIVFAAFEKIYTDYFSKKSKYPLYFFLRLCYTLKVRFLQFMLKIVKQSEYGDVPKWL